MNWTTDQLKQTKVGQMPANVPVLAAPPLRELRDKPGKFIEEPKPEFPHLNPQQIGSDAKLNKTEKAYLQWLLTMNDTRIWVQSIGLRLGEKCFYYPDFAALDRTGMRFIDTKSIWKGQKTPHIEDDALVKMKWAAQIYSPFRFLIAWRDTEGNWKHREI